MLPWVQSDAIFPYQRLPTIQKKGLVVVWYDFLQDFWHDVGPKEVDQWLKTTPTKTQPPDERARRASMQNSRGTSATNQLAGLGGAAVSAGFFPCL